MPVINVTVNALGETRIETVGFVGTTCQDATRALESALGVVHSEQRSKEFYQSSSVEASPVLRPEVPQ